MTKQIWNDLSQVNANEYKEKKGKCDYLSWADAWQLLMSKYPDATYEFKTWEYENKNGLKQIGNATYVETSVSGVAAVGEAGADGYGTILSGSLERSNVDITEELVSLITAQRNFQANAKSIETNSTITQAIINIRS